MTSDPSYRRPSYLERAASEAQEARLREALERITRLRKKWSAPENRVTEDDWAAWAAVGTDADTIATAALSTSPVTETRGGMFRDVSGCRCCGDGCDCGCAHDCPRCSAPPDTALPEGAGRAAIALRKDNRGDLDDVVVEPVRMFRAEFMDDNTLWLCCYLPGGELGDERICWNVTADTPLRFDVLEYPQSGYQDWDKRPRPASAPPASEGEARVRELEAQYQRDCEALLEDRDKAEAQEARLREALERITRLRKKWSAPENRVTEDDWAAWAAVGTDADTIATAALSTSPVTETRGCPEKAPERCHYCRAFLAGRWSSVGEIADGGEGCACSPTRSDADLMREVLSQDYHLIPKAAGNEGEPDVS